MNRRYFVGCIAAAIVAGPVAVAAADQTEVIPRREFYRLTKEGLHPRRVRIDELKPGDLFLTDDLDGIWQAESEPFQIPEPQRWGIEVRRKCNFDGPNG